MDVDRLVQNIPNKMSDTDLRKYISDVVPNAFDFVYLRFDFNSSANVGYGKFVPNCIWTNLIDVS